MVLQRYFRYADQNPLAGFLSTLAAMALMSVSVFGFTRMLFPKERMDGVGLILIAVTLLVPTVAFLRRVMPWTTDERPLTHGHKMQLASVSIGLTGLWFALTLPFQPMSWHSTGAFRAYCDFVVRFPVTRFAIVLLFFSVLLAYPTGRTRLGKFALCLPGILFIGLIGVSLLTALIVQFQDESTRMVGVDLGLASALY